MTFWRYKMNFFALLMAMTLAIASSVLLYVVTTLAAIFFGDMWALWPDLETMESRRLVVAIVLYVLLLVGSWIYTDRQEQRINPRYGIRWDVHMFVLVALPFFLFFLMRIIPENLFLIALFFVLLRAFYEAVRVQQEVVHEEEKIEMAPVSQQ